MQFSKRQFEVAAFGVVMLATWLGWRHAFAVSSSSHQKQVRPQIEVRETVWDFGRVTQTAQLEAGFTVRNIGRQRLFLNQRSQSCDCLSAKKPEVIVPPGRETKIKVVLDTRRFHGAFRERFQYRTNDPDRPTLTLTLVGDIHLGAELIR